MPSKKARAKRKKDVDELATFGMLAVIRGVDTADADIFGSANLLGGLVGSEVGYGGLGLRGVAAGGEAGTGLGTVGASGAHRRRDFTLDIDAPFDDSSLRRALLARTARIKACALERPVRGTVTMGASRVEKV